jgi:GTP-binding protein
MRIQTAVFVKSSQRFEDCPPSRLPEYAFIGRSNVGKSSFINMLTDNHKLAKISSTPGKTQLINHFLVNNRWYLVDLPGYGFAKTPQKVRQSFEKMIDNYIRQRPNLTYLCVLIDSRLTPQAIDLDFLCKLGEAQIPFALIFTKSDKQSPIRTRANVDVFLNRVLDYWEELPPYFITSAENKEGKSDFLAFVEHTNERLSEMRL